MRAPRPLHSTSTTVWNGAPDGQDQDLLREPVGGHPWQADCRAGRRRQRRGKAEVRLAALLLALLFGVHYLNDTIASSYAPPQRVAAAKAWEYILTNAGFCAVLAVVGMLARKPLAWPVIGWG